MVASADEMTSTLQTWAWISASSLMSPVSLTCRQVINMFNNKVRPKYARFFPRCLMK
jgi:hypothetical protein